MNNSDEPTKTSISMEKRSVEFIPLDERTGKSRELFGIWFGFNMVPLALITGAIGIVSGLSFWWSVLAIIIGGLIGGITMGLHASQGPKLGVPQMLQARGQFGSRGAGILTVIVLLILLGFFVSNLVVAAQALLLAIPGIPASYAILFATLTSLVITIVGYSLVRHLSSVAAWVVGVVLLLIAAEAVFNVGDYASLTEMGSFTIASFFMVMMITASWLIGFAPYVSDYSRYMSPDSDEVAAFWGTYLGCTLGAVIVMIIGAFLGSQIAAGDPLIALKENYGFFGLSILIIMFVATALVNCINSYTATLSMLTIFKGVFPKADISTSIRISAVVIFHVIAFFMATAVGDDFLTSFTNFIYLLIYFLVPWSAINLVDYFLIQKGEYHIPSFFEEGGGIYGRWNVNAMLVYGLSIFIEVPFMGISLYTGPLFELLGEVDVASIVGFIFAGVLYYLVNKNKKVDVVDVTA
ncbi:purine-cytosine permease family protein [Psychrobacter sp. AOP7-D1-15]|uniref:purine-cytosine permease family protein n=1 Tax=unclassified Psychrobacter TaxID=196806 RepID=UPI001865CCAF|nr:cytosine permease [Psychrobacter sp. FME61]